jgi:type I restriction enzyme S subunit
VTKLPKGWGALSLRGIAADISYGFTTAASTFGTGPKLLRITDIQDEKVDWSLVPRCTENPSRSYLLQTGDILIARTGATTGKSFLIDFTPEAAVFASYLIRVRVNSRVDAQYLWFFLRSAEYWDQIQNVSKGTAQPGANATVLSKLVIPIAPIPEQRRIVFTLEGLTSRTTRAREQLEKIPKLIQRYREAILGAAFSGELTRDWRAKRGASAPPFTSVDQLCKTITDGDHQAPPKAVDGIPFITISAMNDGYIQLDKATRFVPIGYVTGLKPSRLPKKGDVLYSVTGSFGIPAIVETDEKFVFQRHIAILKPDHQKTTGRFLLRMLASPQILEQARSVATGTAQLTVPLSGLRAFQLPFPTLTEQDEILHRIETAFAWLDRVEVEHANAFRLLSKLDLAILTKAFRGELVPQGSDDEPVEGEAVATVQTDVQLGLPIKQRATA